VKGFVSKSYSDRICESFMRGPGTWLTNWNYPGAAVPKVYRDYSESEDLKLVAERDEHLKNVGYRPTPQRVIEVYGDGYERITEGAAPTTAALITPATPEATRSFAEPAQPSVVGPADEAIERLIGGDGWERVIGPEVNAVAQFLDGATSLDDVRDRLDELSSRDPKAVTESLARVMFAANVAGQLGAEVDDVAD
jgi:phage gp29-like protein